MKKELKKDKVLTLYSKFANQPGITFYPNVENTIYCMNPYNENVYICLDDYFQTIKKAKVNELETIAHSLGAKHVKITFKEQKTKLVSNTKKVEGKISKRNGIMNYEVVKDEYSTLEVASEIEFSGNEVPTEPKLTYFKGESDIASLIKMRLDEDNCNGIKSKTYSFNCTNKREMQESTAVNIDAMLKHLGCEGNTSVVSQVQAEKRTLLEYAIEF